MISIIIPAYNAEKTIVECLNSLKNQQFNEKYEIIVVDDGSTDKSCEIVKRFNVRLIKQNHKGPAAARNLGAKNAKGDTIVFIDSDCIAEKNWLSEIIKPFKDKNIIGVQGAYKTKQKQLIARFAQLEIEDRYEIMKKHKFIDFVGTYSAAYRKDIFLKEGGFDTSFPTASGEDPELSYKLAKKGYKMVFNPKAVVYHTHPDTLLKYLKTKFNRAFYRVDVYKKHKGKAVKDSYTPQILKFQILLFYLIVLCLIASFFVKDVIYLFYLFIILLMLSTLPFYTYALKKDFIVGLISPFIIILRTIVFGLGLFFGILKHFGDKI